VPFFSAPRGTLAEVFTLDLSGKYAYGHLARDAGQTPLPWVLSLLTDLTTEMKSLKPTS
jgi:hypothetical protein